MTRAFRPDPIDDEVLDRVLAAALRAPAAGNTQAFDLVVLSGPAQTARYWDLTLPPERRASFRWQQLLDAPVLAIAVTDPDAYVRRYSEADKVRSGLGAGRDSWPVPYWWVDAGAAIENLLLAATAEGLGVLFFGVFDHADSLAAALSIPDGRELVGTIALGHPAPVQEPGRSTARPRRRVVDAVHHGRW